MTDEEAARSAERALEAMQAHNRAKATGDNKAAKASLRDFRAAMRPVNKAAKKITP